MLLPKRLFELATAALDAGLDRDVLCGFLDPGLASTLPRKGEPRNQLLSDLQHLNRAQPLSDGSLPLQLWLEVAIEMARDQGRHQPFERALEDLHAQVAPTPQPQVPESVSATSAFSLSHRPQFIPFLSKGEGMIGGTEKLDRVRQQLAGGRAAIKQASLTGLGGLGKTQLAVEYCWAYQGEYPGGIVWVTADQDIDAQLLGLCERTRWVHPSTEQPTRLDMLRKRVRELERALLVFDNVERMADIERLIPDPLRQCHVLVTSRHEVAGFDPIVIDFLGTEDATRLLANESGRELAPDTDAVQRILKQLDGLPLALELAGAYLKRRPAVTLGEYADELERKGARARGLDQPGYERLSPTRHEASIERTLVLAEPLFEAQPAVADVLDLFTWSASSSIGWSLLSAALALDDASELREAAGLAEALRILRREEKTHTDAGPRYRMHRLVQEVQRSRRPVDQHTERARSMLVRIGAWFEARRKEYLHLTAFESELDHLAAWQRNAELLGDEATWVRLQWLRAYPPWHRGFYREAADALQIARDRPIAARELHAHILADSGVILSHIGDVREAHQFDILALNLRRELLGEDHPDTALSYNNAGSSRGALGDLQGALDYQLRALEIQRKVLSEQHPETALSYGNVGIMFYELNKHQKALEYALRALGIRQEILGEEHPDTASSYRSVGHVYEVTGDLSSALQYKLRALEILREVLGEKHPATALSYSHVGFTYNVLKNHEKSLEYALRALEIRQDALGEGHPETATSYNNVGSAYAALGAHRKALEHLQRALEIRRESLGDTHPETASGFINVITAMANMNHHIPAFALCKEAIQKTPRSSPKYQQLLELQRRLRPKGFRKTPKTKKSKGR